MTIGGIFFVIINSSHESARRKAMFYTFFAACKQHDVDPEKWLNYVFNHIQDYKISQLHELIPQNWKEIKAEE